MLLAIGNTALKLFNLHLGCDVGKVNGVPLNKNTTQTVQRSTMYSPSLIVRSKLIDSTLGLVLIVTTMTASISQTVLYTTDFSDFPLGDGQWAGNDGWESSHPEPTVHGIVDGYFGDNNRSASIGFNPPNGEPIISTVFRPLNVDPIELNQSFVNLSADVAIADSTNEFYDSFYLSIFNRDAQVLGSVLFDNTIDSFGLWRYDGFEFEELGVLFNHGQLYHLDIRIDFANNLWSAYLDNMSIFTDVNFTEGSDNVRRDLGDFAIEWEVSNLDSPGDNWMLIDNWEVSLHASAHSTPLLSETEIIAQIYIRPNGSVRLRWQGQVNTAYIVDKSSDLVQWSETARVTTDDSAAGHYVDNAKNKPTMSFYRLRLP